MSYVAPVYIETNTGNSALMGIIIASSSVVGIFCDFIFSQIFKNRSYPFFFWGAVLAAMLFPSFLILFPPGVIIFLVSMAIWGIYYELLQFSDFNFIKARIKVISYSHAWVTLSTFRAMAYLIGPVIASFLLTLGTKISFFTTISLEIIAALLFFLFSRTELIKSSATTQTSNFSGGLKTWIKLIKKVWPVYIFLFLLFLIDSTYWTIGTLVSEQLHQAHNWGNLFLPAYSLPALIMHLAISKLGRPVGKKYTAYLACIFAGILLFCFRFVSDPLIIIYLVFSSSLFLAVAVPEILATFEDYVSELGPHGNEMVGLQSSAVSLGYIVGPITSGYLATKIGNLYTFSLLGLILFMYSVIAFVITPRKIQVR